ECVLERVDQGVLLDPFLALDRAHRLDDLSRHLDPPSSIRLPRTISAYGTSTRSLSETASASAASSAATTVPRKRFRPAMSLPVRSATLRPTTPRKCAGLRSGLSVPGEDTSIE